MQCEVGHVYARWGEGVTMATRPGELFVGSKVLVGDLNMKHKYTKN